MYWNTITNEGGLVVETGFVSLQQWRLVIRGNPQRQSRVSGLSRAHYSSFVQLDEGVNVCKNCM